MSEYQYYEFRAIDRPLTDAEMDALRAVSTRAEITSTSFTNDYQWGDLKADPFRLLEKYFDAFIYVANWGVRRFWLRFPSAWIDHGAVQRMLLGESAWVRRTGSHIIVGFDVGDLEPDDFDDGTSWMGTLVSLRSDLLRGDLRCLYLGWLLSTQIREFDVSQGVETSFKARIEQLRVAHNAKTSFLDRLTDAAL
jgi:hypothetical protein